MKFSWQKYFPAGFFHSFCSLCKIHKFLERGFAAARPKPWLFEVLPTFSRIFFPFRRETGGNITHPFPPVLKLYAAAYAKPDTLPFLPALPENSIEKPEFFTLFTGFFTTPSPSVSRHILYILVNISFSDGFRLFSHFFFPIKNHHTPAFRGKNRA